MKRILHIILIVCFVLLAGFTPASGISSFRVLGDIPHLPILDPASITAPEPGMLIFSSSDMKPMIYTGSAWETLCTGNINSVTAQEYFSVKEGIPFLPTFGNVPGGTLPSGTVYYSTVDNSIMVYNGTGWLKMVDLLIGNIDESSGFSAGMGVKTFKLPVLNSNPSPAGLTAGAFYINSVSKTIRFYDGSVWQDISCQAVVKTLPLTVLTGYTAMGGGEVTTNGGYPVTLTGICWSPNADPDTLLTTKTKVIATGTGVGLFTSQLTGLLPNTTYHVRAYAVNSQGIVYGDDLAFTTPIQPPVIITLDATNIKSISAESGGDITADGGSSVTKRGIIWSAVSDPLNDPSDIITNDGSGVGIYPSTLDALLGLTTYYVRAYAVNSAGYAYGNLVQFTTPAPVPPVLNPTLTLTNIAGDSAVGTALIMNNGGAFVTERGICYSTDQLTYTYIKSTTVTPTDIGAFITHLTGLQQGTTYYVKGYATNSVGTGYTSETSFKTARFVGITTVKPHDPAGTIAWSGGVITDVGFSDITARGICWSMYKNPTTDSISKTSDPVTGDGTGTYASQMTGLLPGITYYVRAYAVNLAGTSYGNLDSISMPDYAKVQTLPASSLYLSNATVGGNVLDDGGAAVTERGVCWSTNPNPAVSNNHTSDGNGLGLFTTYLTGLSMDVTYHYRAYAVNSVGVSYGGDSIFYINHNAPLIITLPASEITSMSGNSGGDIQDGGGASITLRGIMWSTKGDPLTDPLANVITNDGSGVGMFPTKMDNLLGSTTYYVRAYAVNRFVKAYGDLKVFTTLPPILAVVMSPGFTMEDVTNTTATGEFLILNNGGDPITDRGIRYTTDHVNYAYVSSNTLNKTDIGTYRTFLSGLAPNTTYYAQAYAINKVGVALSSEASFRTTSLAVLTTTKPYSVNGFGAYSGGEITSTGDDIISAKGICWSISNNPTADLVTKTSEAVSGVGTGIFTSHMTGLNPGVKYYVRAYAVNTFGIAYGNLDSLFTSTTAFITTSPVTNVTNTTAVGGGYISDDGHDAVYTRGVCWSTSPNPTTSDSYGSNGSGIGSYQVTLTGLLGSTKYYVRAYAINSVGTAYGNLDSLKTSPPGLPTVSTTDVINIGGTTATGRGKVVNNGGAVVDERGFCWNTTGTPSLSDAYAASGQGNGTFSGGVTGLTPNTKYYIRAYATNSVGTSYGNEIIFSTFTIATVITTPASQITSTDARSGGNIVSDGGALVYSSGICWNTTGSPTIYDTGTNSGLGIGEFIHSLTGLMGSTSYYIRAYAINDAGTAYGNEVVFTTSPAVVPTLTTTVVGSGAAGTTAVCGGAVSSNGGALINTEGVVWSTISGFLPDTVTVNRSVQAGLGNFNSTLTGLKPGTTYYVRAYATNSAGTAYAANEVSVTTFDVPAITTTAPTSITNVNITSGGTITSNGGTDVTESGLCWSTESIPTVAGEHFSNGPAFGLFTRTITELMGSTTYYLRAYALNSVGLVYGQVERCTTQPPVLATILTVQPVATSSVAATSGGNILSHGGSMVTSRGIYWSTQENFNPDTISINKTSQTGYYTGTFNANLTGLTPNTVYYVKAFVVNGVGTSYGDEMSFRTPTLATLTTAYATSDGPTRGVSGGAVSDDGGAGISSRGVVWSTVASFNPDTVVVNRTYNGGGTGTFVSRPAGLKGSTTYYIMAYATNIAGTSYGNLLSFTTDPATPPNLTTRDAWYVYGTSATTGGYVSDNGGEPITTRGVVWGTDPSFRADTVVVNKTVDGAMGIGYFSTTMTGLTRGTTYYVKAYARNSIGTAYGNVISFTTLDFAKLTTMPVAPSSTGYAAGGGGTLTSDGGTPVTNNGVCWSINPNPTVGLYTKTTYDGWSGSNFYSSLTGLSPVTKYYVRAYASNNQGTAYGNEVTFTTPPALATIFTTYATPTSKSSVVTGGNITANGGAPVTERGVLWSNDATFNPDTVVVNKTSDGTGTGKFNSLISNMQLSISYYIRAYAVNSAGISYGNQIAITLFPTAPILNTTLITQVAGSTAMSGGEITSDGGADVTLKGLCWNTSTNPITTDFHTTNGSGIDAFAAMITGLAPNTLYYVRAYAINKIGTAYGIERTFQTNGIPTLTATTPVTNIIATTATSGGEITDDGRAPILSRGICWSTYSNPTIALTTKTVDISSDSIGKFVANMKGLTSNTTYFVRAYATNSVGTGYGSQVQFTTLPIMLPTLKTLAPTAIDSVKATSGGNILDDGGVPITGRGICWSAVRNFDITVSTKVYNAVSDTGVYNNNLTGLSPGIKYYVRAFAINSKGVAYGNLDSLTTQAIRATVSNVVISNITRTTANGSASVITDGGAKVTVRGICWSMTPHPTITNDTLCVGNGLGAFGDTLKSLVEGKTYYVRAFATNSIGTAYSAVDAVFQICPSAFTVFHYEGLNGAAVTKNVTYGSVSTNLSGAARCWITQNLGADHQAISATDGTEPSAGWYWQFNRSQGYQYTSARYPATWVATINETSDWVPANDPCNLLLGNGWRIPTSLEWTNADGAPQNWNNSTNTFSSVLKLHGGGYLAGGAITLRGNTGEFWSSNQASALNGVNLGFNTTVCTIQNNAKSTNGFSLRCLRDSIVITKPSVSDVTIAGKSKTTVLATAAATPDGGAPVTGRGFCWNTTGDPVITDNPVSVGDSTGVFTDSITGLAEGTTYYIRGYATNSIGTSYSSTVTVFKVCLPDFTVQHVVGLNGAPVSKTVTYHSVSSTYSGAARCWLTQNLGADHQATSVTDATEPSAGWYWQFNRLQGYQYAAGRLPSTTWTSMNESSDWVPANDPCNRMLGGGWRIPTATEYASVITNGGIPFTTPLKLHYSGYLNNADGSILGRNTYGIFWSSSATTNTVATYLQFSSGVNTMYTNTASSKWYGFTLRCLKDTVVVSTPSVSDVTFTTMTSTSVGVSAIVTPDGGSPVTERGFCWNTTGNPSITDVVVSSGAGTGNFTGTISGGLTEGPTYYVRAYAKNSLGIAYSTGVNSFRICPPVFTVEHIQGIDGAPVSKKVAYHSISSTLTGKAVCWLVQNLGADSIASKSTDATEASSGWYWQFNRIQGYKHDGTTRTPATSWISINETSNWTSTNDPCGHLLGSGWRIPTLTEWTNVIANGNLATTMAYDSPLKMHVAGYIDGSTLYARGTTSGIYWSSNQSTSTIGSDMYFSTGGSVIYSAHTKSQYGFSLRCLRDTIVVSKPSVGAVSISISSMTGTTADATSGVGSDGGAPVLARGICWNTTGNPTLADSYVTNSAGGTGSFTNTITGLSEGPKFYVRAFATNSAGTSYGEGTGFSAILTGLCPDTFNIQHNAGFRGAPVTKSVTYHAVGSYLTGAAKCWITQNLGADHPATSAVDATEASAGWYFQFNHSLGYKNNGTTTTPVAWITGFNELTDWTALNDPCSIMLGTDWRLPTGTEWTNVEGAPQNWATQTDAYNSELKLHNAGNLTYNTSGISSRGTQGNYWSSTRASATAGMDLQFNSTTSAVISNDKAYGFSVRCLREGVVKMPPTLSNVVVSTTTMTDSTAEGSAKIVVDGGSVVLTRGICWNTTGNPTITDNPIPANLTDSTFSGIIKGLKEGLTYYVRAYATNKIGLGYSPQTTTFRICPPAFNVVHSAGFNGSPVTKTVTYHSVNSTLSGAARCWTTQNLGADRPANAANDTTAAAAGWYWQFNRLQGFKADGAVLTPSAAWQTTISESSDWTAATDPCSLMLSTGWRIPTSTEWSNAVINGSWASKSAYASDLKLHYGGQIKTAALADRGSLGHYWTGMQTAAANASYLEYNAATGVSQVLSSVKSGVAKAIRCLRDNLVISMPTVSNVTVIQQTDSIVVGSASVTPDGGAPVTIRGLCWSITGIPTITDNVINCGTDVGTFIGSIKGLTEGFSYYIRAFATNSAGTSYSPSVVSFKICKPVKAIHIAGLNGAPVSKTLTYGTVSTNLSGKLMCWLTQNLGSDNQATSVTDASEASAGWYWQFNRAQGYKYTTTRTPADAWTAWIASISENSDWQAANDPCNLLLGLGWRVPTSAEWTSADGAPQNWGAASDAYNSVLKLHEAGVLLSTTGVVANRGTYGYYWSSTQYSSTSYGNYLYIYNGYSAVTYNDKAYGQSVRCIRDTIVLSKPMVSDVSIPDSTITSVSAKGLATVSSDGGALISSRGICWNTTGNPTIADNTVSTGNGIGNVSEVLMNLTEGPTYYVRAYATNSKGTAYSPNVTSFKICPRTFSVIHTAGLNGAPVTKTVTYHSISANISGAARCWLTQNLGAVQQATAVTDATEASSGWYWQFNRSQGYQYTTALTPSNAWTAWITSISESSNWQAANDPCNLLLGLGWRIPTSTEWINADAPPQNWGTAADAYNSLLKLHEAGVLLSTTGVVTNRGTYGYYWSSTQYSSTSYGNYLYIYNGYSAVTYNDKAYGQSVRCLRDTLVISKPSVSDVRIPTATMTATTATGLATVTYDGGTSITSRGLCWNTTGNPTIADNIISTGSGIGNISEVLLGLVESPTYYVRAYATNAKGTAYSPTVSSFKICPSSFSVIHTAGLNGAPVSKTVIYHSISSNISGAARCWLTQNLGADSIANAVTDSRERTAGWYWQFNQLQGYQYSTTRTPANAWTPWITGIFENNNWQSANDPCNLLLGLGWRIPTSTEWTNADAPPQNWGTAADAYASELKLHQAGLLLNTSGGLANRGTYGYYWSSTQYSSVSYGNYLYIYNGYSAVTYNDKADAQSVRCIRDTIVLAKPSVSDVTIPTATMTATAAVGSATVSSTGGSPISSRGLCWNTTGNPTIADNKVSTGSGIGGILETLSGLGEGPTYYVRAYATNSQGTAYSPDVSSFKICPTTFTVIHTAGLNGAPVSKNVIYQSISSNISGSALCWLTQNLGADQQAASVTDATESSAGWYWQFNRSQGYQYTTALTPSNAWTAWITSISESSNWQAANDPCNLLLGLGWRIPTSIEWTAADAPPQNWGTAADAYASELKLHQAGLLLNTTGVLANRGGYGYYWSSTQYSSTTYGNYLYIYNGYSAVTYNEKSTGQSVRCLRDMIVVAKPSVSDVTIPTATMTATTAVGSAVVTSDGGASISARGLCWNTTGNPTIGDNTVSTANGIGNISETLTGLGEGPTYYVRAYATNSQGTAYSPDVSSFKICPTTFTVIHTAGLNGAPVSKNVTYHSISSNISGAALCWLTQNLGADQQAAAVTDATESSAGWYWQFNRSQGYQYTTALTPSNAWTAWITSISESSNWQAANDPCNLLLGLGWRLPTSAEWTNADAPPQNWVTAADAYNSVLKLHEAGLLLNTTGVLANRGTYGYYWSSTQYSSTTYGNYLYIYNGYSAVTYNEKSTGQSVRCLRDMITVAKPSVSDVTVPTATMTATTAVGSAVVATDGGAAISARGLCWNTTGNPTITDNTVSTGSGIGNISETLTGLGEGPTYYVRAYATNSQGTTYSPDVSSFKICPTSFTVIHTAGLNGAPVTKTVNYHSISSNISGAAACWLTQNLGADQQATSVTDATESSAGWYWQFNRSQGYQYTGSRTPAYGWVPWVTGNSENSNWLPANDPCALLLGSGWRIPTSTEWTNADAPPQNWGTAADAYNSVLKLHEAGELGYSTGVLANRGGYGYYWSSTQYSSTSYGNFLYIYNGYSAVTYNDKAYGQSVRCLRDMVVPAKPSVSDVTIPTAAMTASSATGTATVTPDGGATVIDRGLCWNTTGNPTTADNTLSCGTGVGIISATLAGLTQGPTYYVRGYATNSAGTSYSLTVSSFKICPTTFTLTHTAGVNGAPVTKTINYTSISSNISGAAKCWLTQNLGADQQATSVTDNTEAAAGWYWQFNRSQGYQYTTTRTPATAWNTSISENSNWITANDPCALLLGTGWRIPTSLEWSNVDAPPQYWLTAADAYNSELKLHEAGELGYSTGVLANRGGYGYYWSSTQYSSTSYGNFMYIYNGYSAVTYNDKSYGQSVRCIKD